MRVLTAFDKFKNSLTARQACDIAARAIRAKHPDWEVDRCPLTDGGEGFVRILTAAAGGRTASFPVTAPRGGLVEAEIGLVPLAGIPEGARALLDLERVGATETIAVVEMAAASGLALLPPGLRDPWQATTHGTGQLIRGAAEMGAGAVLLGVGGSATHDLGLGALEALGLEFRAADGRRLRPPIPAHWEALERIEGEVYTSIPPIRIACDVSNPLLGPRGAAAVYAPQKGLRPEDYDRLEAGTRRVASLLCDYCGQPRELADRPGAGAAGGIAFGLMAAARARLLPGFDLVSAWLGLGTRIAAADLVITGEGRFDRSSLEGKGPGAVAARARTAGKTVHVFAGAFGEAPPDPGLRVHAITPRGTPLDDALREAGSNLFHSIEDHL
jgi:glycerate kinase